ncbi:thermonuclease family protein [Roseobacter sp. HKCCD9010]|uniref:thermonuclease family protein n=1 Tax=unclassified Roseobacter TaxID=196798 RepID=UPI001492358C|nr:MULTISPECIES: thermonuclease family protein [unclassified Roseobacter]MBF9049172.1 thermonuclease family protein [Rhodobacterales bacterium HKCCD4356]NNV11172.1 thermonuclease family protein [Roseobacter sp. HKCCD7357]NNV15356.1 thermonuclease family protein [Roseobacter sp. HKCCD8768]NNV24816.1 thermonuclease family protein [Roseobacter sp. HKCCD8192]NNV29072.1 thermonuclease family protein [Roseobacter sp. HKCCD9061]
MRKCSCFVCILATLYLFTLSPGGAEVLRGAVEILDGDTLRLDRRVVRLDGIDAPEQDQRCRRTNGDDWACGVWVAAQVAAETRGAVVSCVGDETDRYGRLLARCTTETGQDLGDWLVSGGMARAYRRYSMAYAAQEDAARAAGVGLWAGAWSAPADHRARCGALLSDVAAGCAIKGNISDNGRIYHVPGSRSYGRTRIDLARGERWFCTIAEAEAAGWRAPRG